MRALCAAILVGACACGLAKGGLLVEAEQVDDASTGDDSGIVTVDATGDDATSPWSDEAASDAPEVDEAAVDAGRIGHADARAEARSDSAADGRSDVTADGDADGALVDALAEGQADAAADVAEGGGDNADAADDATPEPIVWDGGTIPDPQFSDSDWIQFCAALTGCSQMPSISACVALLKQPSASDALIPPPAMITGIENASPDCTVVADALDDGSPCASATADTCQGNALVTCRWGFRLTIDCGSIDMVCSGGDNAGCGFGACSAAQEGQTYCVGSSYVAKCVGGRYVPSVDCKTFGGTCFGPAGSASCQGMTGVTCVDGPATCMGDAIVTCMNGLAGGVDCTSAYDSTFTCLDDASGAPICAADDSCDPTTWLDTCTPAGGVSFCNAGAPSEYDCSSNAWSGCAGGKCTP